MTIQDLDDNATLLIFDQVVSGWLQCEVRSDTGPCPFPAGYHVTFHDCGRGLVCAEHLVVFLEQVPVAESALCNRCGREFPAIDDAVTVVEL